MIDTYKGESPAKKLTRFAFWESAILNLSAERRAKGAAAWTCDPRKFVVLASRHGGDVSVLSAWNVPHRAVTAVDRCPDAAAECQQRWPDANVVTGNVEDYVTAATDVLFLDFCAPICRDTVATAKACLAKLRVGALFGVGVLKGRENAAELPVARTPLFSRKDRRIVDAMTRNMPPGVRANTRANFGLDKYTGHSFCGKHASERFHAITYCAPDETRLRPIEFWHYVSATSESRGVPMLVGLFRLEKFRHRKGGGGKDEVMYTPIEADESELRRKALDMLPWCRRNGIADETRFVAQALAIPRSTLIAWKAHAARGSYVGAGLGIEPRGPGV